MRAQIGKIYDLGKNVRDSDRAAHPITHNKWKEPFVLDDIDTLVDDELSSDSSPFLSLSLAKNSRESTKAKLRKIAHHLAFSDAISGSSRRARREAGRGQNQPDRVLGNVSVLPVGAMPPIPLVHPAFGIGPTF